MEPTAQQLANRLNPTPVTYNVPSTEGLFRSTTDFGSTLYRKVGDRYEQFDLVNALVPMSERQTVGNYGAQANLALQRLKDMYGLDWNSLPAYNIGDLGSAAARSGGFQIANKAGPEGGPDNYFFSGGSDITSFLGAQAKPVAGSTSTTVNTQPNTLSPDAKQPVNNGTPVVQPSTAGVGATTPPGGTSQVSGAPTANVPAQTYTIQAGDTLSKLAQTYGTTVGALMSLNPQITDANKIYTGQKLNLTAPQVGTVGGTTGGLKGTDQAPDAMVQQAQMIQDEINRLKSPANTGVPEMPETETGKTETTNIMDTFAKVSTALGLGDIKSQYNKTLDESKAEQDKKNDEAQNINNNPWYSEGKRQMELKKLDKKYETRLNTLSNYAKLYDSMYQEGLANARYLTTGIQQEQQFAMELAMKKQEAIDELNQADIQVVESDGGIYAIDKKTGKMTTLKASTGGTGGGGVVGADEQLYSGLSSATATAVRAQVSSWKSEPQVQNFATVQDGYNFSQTLKSDTTNPADDQALIYSLAKALDPNSVVREGEYATAQKYAQSWIKAYGKGVEQAILGTGFLSKEARENIKKTIAQKYTSTKMTYDNLYQQKISSINALTGRTDGARFLTDYAMSTGDDASGSNFDNLLGDLTVNEATKKAYLPRRVWATVQDKDALLAEVIADGYELLIND
jgi:LysM repeat protein